MCTWLHFVTQYRCTVTAIFVALCKSTMYSDYCKWQDHSRQGICPNDTLCISNVPNTVTTATSCSDTSRAAVDGNYSYLYYWISCAIVNMEWWNRRRRRNAPAGTDADHFFICKLADDTTGHDVANRQAAPADSSVSFPFTLRTKLWCDKPLAHHLSCTRNKQRWLPSVCVCKWCYTNSHWSQLHIAVPNNCWNLKFFGTAMCIARITVQNNCKIL